MSSRPAELGEPRTNDTEATRNKDYELGHLVLRVVVGVNILGHGLARIGSPGAFADALTHDFASTPLPSWSVRLFALTLPFLEFAVGLLVLLGLRLREALLAGGAIIAALTLGMTLRQQWEVVGLQLIYGLAYAALLAGARHARFTLDARIGRTSAPRLHPARSS
ncbi:hypothetical protein AKJ09_07241 [Labilithrix luteola]|uniref:Methylamine utilisation protein MauE domain-containing protein n=1 Tax=Labilithrix luteola TaxID=1391654 RepID=A0A0K1Q4B5_9BACT|nr:DoxX family membrane protein [Labilithrix luteola]AKV00578.1 hypothetical protein AKJ09_07241 [Labilithrix luteola]